MLKFLLVLLVVGIGVWSLVSRLRGLRGDRTAGNRPAGKTGKAPVQMVECAHCGLHLPRSEALTHGKHHYCCAEHQRRDAA